MGYALTVESCKVSCLRPFPMGAVANNKEQRPMPRPKMRKAPTAAGATA